MTIEGWMWQESKSRHATGVVRRDRRVILDDGKRVVYDDCVIRTFATAETERFFRTGKARYLPSDIRARAGQRLLQLDAAREVQDLRLPPSNNLEKLVGDRKGQWSIRISKQWRLCFRFERGDAFEVEIVDYH